VLQLAAWDQGGRLIDRALIPRVPAARP